MVIEVQKLNVDRTLPFLSFVHACPLELVIYKRLDYNL